MDSKERRDAARAARDRAESAWSTETTDAAFVAYKDAAIEMEIANTLHLMTENGVPAWVRRSVEASMRLAVQSARHAGAASERMKRAVPAPLTDAEALAECQGRG